MSARVYFMKRVNDCKDVAIMSLQDEQWRRTSLLSLYNVIFLLYLLYNFMQWKHKQTNCKHRDENLSDFSFLSRYHHTKSKNYLKRQYRIRHWIPMSILDICTVAVLQIKLWNRKTTFIKSHVYLFWNRLIKWDGFDTLYILILITLS